MKEKKQISNEEALARLYVSTLNYVQDSTMLTIKFYENLCKRLRNEIIEHENIEPLKIFKKSHQQWEQKLRQLNINYDTACENLLNECKDFSNIIDIYNN